MISTKTMTETKLRTNSTNHFTPLRPKWFTRFLVCFLSLSLAFQPLSPVFAAVNGSGSNEVEFLRSKLTATDTIQLLANSQIVIEAAELVSDQGHIDLMAGLGITIEDDLAATQYQAKGKFGKRSLEESLYQTIAIRALLDAGKGVRLHTDLGDITLKAKVDPIV